MGIINQPSSQIERFVNDTLTDRNDGTVPEESVVTTYFSIWIGASYVLGAWLSSFFSAFLGDSVGRKWGLVSIAPIMMVSAVLGAISKEVGVPELLIASRVIAGIHSGLCKSLNILYMIEISPNKI